MSRYLGEAKFNPLNGMWKIVIWIEGGDVILNSDSVFHSQDEAEEFLVKSLRGLGGLGGEDQPPPANRNLSP